LVESSPLFGFFLLFLLSLDHCSCNFHSVFQSRVVFGVLGCFNSSGLFLTLFGALFLEVQPVGLILIADNLLLFGVPLIVGLGGL
jgi:hypothetical protein